ncbi:Ger(x)C family germination protein [Paenibacillus castaneae]|uniref:Ger(x)C family spore germination protein n=1 Tax=Paenibacillus castaneae TaxID=474957 RepID=UPI000C9BAB2B|nr:Ger(x)C family spore germination protein [Paenibacillus castaneae]NIK78116.1 Ger(x)C family germination protein [Paenibacillus castaneae]
MKRIYFVCLLLSLTVLPGCVDEVDIEDISLSLMVGIDLDEDNRLVISSSSPVFNKEAEEKEENTSVIAITPEQSEGEFDATITALSSRGKVQMLLIGKRVFQHKDWFNILDTIYRNGQNTTLSRVVLVDGAVEELMKFKPKDKPRLPVYLLKLIDTAHEQNLTVKTSLQELHRQFWEKGESPTVTELKKDGEVTITGTSILNRDGLYKLSLDLDETKWLRILQNETDGEFSFTIQLPEQPSSGLFQKNRMSFFPNATKVKVKTSFADDKFIFNYGIDMRIVVTERLFRYDIMKKEAELEKEIQKELEKKIEQLVKKVQRAKVDPFGLGLYARAYEYPHWKQVQDNWEDTFSKAEVHAKVKVKILSMGSTK